MPKTADHADIVASWKTKAVTINRKRVTVTQFIHDMQTNKDEPGENEDLIRECKGIDHFSWVIIAKILITCLLPAASTFG